MASPQAVRLFDSLEDQNSVLPCFDLLMRIVGLISFFISVEHRTAHHCAALTFWPILANSFPQCRKKFIYGNTVNAGCHLDRECLSEHPPERISGYTFDAKQLHHIRNISMLLQDV
jgi:hypothetical protein